MNRLEAYLRIVAEDPMWADHVVMRKSTVVKIADALSTLGRELDEARADFAKLMNDYTARGMEIMGRGEALEAAEAERDTLLAQVGRLRETNKKLHRRAQLAEAIEQSFMAAVGVWQKTLVGTSRHLKTAPGAPIDWNAYRVGQRAGVQLLLYDLEKRRRRAALPRRSNDHS